MTNCSADFRECKKKEIQLWRVHEKVIIITIKVTDKRKKSRKKGNRR